MLTKQERKNIRSFEKLSAGHKRVFRFRLRRKIAQYLVDLQIVLLHCQELGIKPKEAIDVHQLGELIDLFEKLSVTKSVNNFEKIL